ncbi:MAG: DUF3168 domain-containing protein [Paracoccus sp. (in: a-proteobacteria)]|uniref:DUF3168 domain-containing protein n=1 Tax=Paracoccus sp. TaxID=267 RepID=UPI0026DEC3D9|nr:DUF3168 domain-containing protein [Paracoccus sp. (in: a-proteobacteria)]MDO5630444.1 DUF3168 domain-containing protein [Paracoccus sp. (in: a-proteobacteria)]
MSYAAAIALQGAVYQHLRLDPALAGLVGDAIYDAMPIEAPAGTYVALGPEDVADAGDYTARGSRHDFVVSVLTGADEGGGFRTVKAAAAAVSDALERGDLRLDQGHLAGLWFLRARARRDRKGAARRVDMTFRARIDLG